MWMNQVLIKCLQHITNFKNKCKKLRIINNIKVAGGGTHFFSPILKPMLDNVRHC